MSVGRCLAKLANEFTQMSKSNRTFCSITIVVYCFVFKEFIYYLYIKREVAKCRDTCGSRDDVYSQGCQISFVDIVRTVATATDAPRSRNVSSVFVGGTVRFLTQPDKPNFPARKSMPFIPSKTIRRLSSGSEIIFFVIYFVFLYKIIVK